LGMVGQGHALAALSPGKNLCIHFAGSWMGFVAGLDRCKNLAPPPPLGFEPQTAQNVANRDADYAIQAARVYVNILYYTGRSFHSGNVRRGAEDIFPLATDDSACSVVVSPPLSHVKEERTL
jgi:hypothetical protein